MPGPHQAHPASVALTTTQADAITGSGTSGYVVRDPADDRYSGEPHDVWLAQRALFESTYDWT
jgi:hypothetical protein